jgi:flagellar basal-body rod modification protein FlgD
MDGINVVGAQNVQKSDQFDRNNQIDKEMFLKLLVAQLKHQDPLSPVDNNDFLNQSVQFSTLEAIQNLTKDFSQMKAMEYLGKEVSFRVSESSNVFVGKVDSVSVSQSGNVTVNIGEKSISPENIIGIGLSEQDK